MKLQSVLGLGAPIGRSLIAAAFAVGTAPAALAQSQSCPADLGEHESVLMVTGTPTGTWFPTGAAIAELANSNYEGQPVGVQPGSGAIGNIMTVGTGRAEMGLSYGPFLLMAQRGSNDVNPGEPMPELRGVLSLATNAFHIMQADDAPFESFEELAEKKPEVWMGSRSPIR